MILIHYSEPVPKPIYNFTPLWNFGAFAAQNAANRAIRSNSSDLPMQILRDFRFYPLRPTG
jgi:hypothetical protein